ncbi:hypothetical protein DSM104299_02325 [Baekduia alba]|uniref:choice-of-anchor Q domain-containing protein n=1 Tax=Baekduia alba TaxID=2997333 RepID=UPI002340FD91|nr:choice-of-anchor Q domain-containing protein [Baekduia alba]WCB93609.1 hypothetical protein DSM104299_02325 [Baekduia alba]
MPRTSLALALALLALAPAGAHAASITVDDGTDVLANDGRCTLREAVQAVTTTSPVGGCAAGTGNDVVTIAVPKVTLTRAGAREDGGATGDLDLTGTLTIRGAGATVDANHLDRAFDVQAGARATLEDITVTDGLAPAGADAAVAGADGEGGGGIRSAGALTLRRVTVTGNATQGGGNGLGSTLIIAGRLGGARGGHGGDGGGVLSTGALTILASRIAGNATGAGGAGADANATGQNDGLDGFDAIAGEGGRGGAGGGVASDAAATIADTTVVDNATGAGGAGAIAHSAGGLGASSGAAAGDGGFSSGGRGGDGGGGGGIAVLDAGDLTLDRSLVLRNRTGSGGASGAAFAGSGGNGSGTAKGGAGGLAVGGRGGGGGHGGGLGLGFSDVSQAKAVVTDATVTQNATGGGRDGADGISGFGGVGGAHAGGAGGDLYSGSGGDAGAGAGIGAILHTSLSVRSSTLVANTVATTVGAHGGGIAFTGGSGTPNGADGVVHPGAVGRAEGGGLATAYTPALVGSIVASNTPDQCASAADPSVVAADNIIFGVTGPSPCPSATATDPGLRPLADNGGPTQTMGLTPGSFAINRIDAGRPACAATDARGVPRPAGGRCDVGAYEVAAPGLSADATANGVIVGAVDARRGDTTVHVEYGTTAAHGTRTGDLKVPAGTDPARQVLFTLPGLAPGTTYHYSLLGSNQDGTASTPDATFAKPSAGGGGPGTKPGTTPPPTKPSAKPVLSRLKLSPASFRRGKSTTITWTDSAAVTTTFSVQRKASGVRKGKACVAKPKRAAAKGRAKPKACTRWLAVKGTFTHADRAGTNTSKWTGRLRGKKLAAGAYRLVATPKGGKPVTRTFTVKR